MEVPARLGWGLTFSSFLYVEPTSLSGDDNPEDDFLI